VAPPDVRGRVARARIEGSQGHTRSRAPQAEVPGARLCDASSARAPPSLSVWRSRSFQLLWAARTISLTGSAVTLVVLQNWVRPFLPSSRSPCSGNSLPAARDHPSSVAACLQDAVGPRLRGLR
jgi:hypothetical protein